MSNESVSAVCGECHAVNPSRVVKPADTGGAGRVGEAKHLKASRFVCYVRVAAVSGEHHTADGSAGVKLASKCGICGIGDVKHLQAGVRVRDERIAAVRGKSYVQGKRIVIDRLASTTP